MLKLENYEVVGWEHAIRGMRNPKNSWNRSDSEFTEHELEDWPHNTVKTLDKIGPNDHDLMMRLAKGGPVHAKYRRMIVVYVDITAPLYWWKEFDTYKVATVANSCSTMHKIADKEFTLEDFSCEHLFDDYSLEGELTYTNRESFYDECNCFTSKDALNIVIDVLNHHRMMFIETKDKKYWWQMIQLLPSSYNQKRTVMLNYEVLHNIYISRKNHKLDEWHTLCDWIRELPYSEIITGERD